MPFLIYSRISKAQTSLTQIIACKGPPIVPLTGVGAIQRVSIEAGETGDIVRMDNHITFHRQGVTELRSIHDGAPPRIDFSTPGSIHIRPASSSHASSWDTPVGLTLVSLEPRFIRDHAADLFQQDMSSFSFRPMIGVKDEFLWQLGMKLDAQSSTVDPPRAFLESVMATMAMHLASTAGFSQHPVQARALSRSALRRTKEFVDANLSANISLSSLAALTGLSIYHFSRQFSREVGVGVGRYIQQRKMQRAAQLLVDRQLSIADVGEAVGYSDPSSFSRAFRSVYGVPPNTFRRVRR
ncbi:helix-turn-helix transcriptional regulator [Phyllobacterium ifriqiyense]|uniref:helix-turn-helix transcriptional regulator n=1 Tax=Phyllobacterium ifriqiyense TaxID=314238 RepID=UPI003398A51D